MASPDSWLSPDVLHALGWALIHSLWQCLAVAALAASLMAFSRRSSIRYLVAVGALALMLALPVATFFLLMKSAASAHVFQSPGSFVSAFPAAAYAPAVAATPATGIVGALENLPRAVPPPSLLPWLVGAWLCGVAFFSLRFAGGFLLLEHMRRRQSTIPGPHILALCRDLQRQLGLDRAIRYLECGWLQAPAVIGWFHPIILLPVMALTGLSEEQLRAVIAHELAHIRRLDLYVNLFQILVEALLFYHPAMWWLNKRIRAERELCCDEIAVSLTGSRLEYAQALTVMAAWKKAPRLAMAANRGPLSLRVLHILGRKPSGAGQRMLGLTGGILFLTAALTAANALFGIAYPIPAAHAKESFRAALASGQVAVDHAVRQAFQAATKDTGTKLGQTGGAEMAARIEPSKNVQAEKLVPLSFAELSRSLRRENLATTVVALNDAGAAMPGDQPAASVHSEAPVLASLSPVVAKSNEPPTVHSCRSAKVFARVLSPEEIQLSGFTCFTVDEAGSVMKFGSCPLSSTDLSDRERGCRFDLTMKVHLADPADAAKMQMNRVVRLGGDVHVTTQNHADALTVENARVLQADPFGLSQQPFRCRPQELTEISRHVGHRLCVQNDVLANLNATAPALQAAAGAPVHDPKVNKPSGDADAITCRQYGTGIQPLNCAYDGYWVWADLHPRSHTYYAPADGPFYSGENSGTGGGGLAQGGVVFSW